MLQVTDSQTSVKKNGTKCAIGHTFSLIYFWFSMFWENILSLFPGHGCGPWIPPFLMETRRPVRYSSIISFFGLHFSSFVYFSFSYYVFFHNFFFHSLVSHCLPFPGQKILGKKIRIFQTWGPGGEEYQVARNYIHPLLSFSILIMLYLEKSFEELQYCVICRGYKAPRAHHCRKCGR